MSDCQENIKESTGYGTVMAATDAKKPIGDGPLITAIAATTVGIFFGLRAMDVGQHDALVTSTSLVWLFSLLLWER